MNYNAVYGAAATAVPPARPGTLPVGSRVRIGQYKVVVERFLSEGGFAHVYLVQSSLPIPDDSDQRLHVLKRLAVPDKEQLQHVRKEVDIMKLLRGHRHIINFIEASASELPNKAGYEVFILMEYAAGGGIIDMMNTRLENRLTESEILKIFSDTVEAVGYMHYQDPPLMHRDLKVENILQASPSCYKLCDFGSATSPLSTPPQTALEIQALEADLNKTTTLQYRAPEMCDVWSRKGVGLPADIWALGVFLYKLCYYTTPFEAQGILAIQNVQYTFPPYPAYSSNIKDLISSMLKERQEQRPTIFQVHEKVCQLRGVSLKFHPKASSAPPPSLPKRPAQGRVNEQKEKDTIFTHSITPSPTNELTSLTNSITPMRRGRPTNTATKLDASPGFENSFKPSAVPSSSARSEYPDFEQAFPPLPEEVLTATTPVPTGSTKPAASQSLSPPGQASFSDTFTPLEVERQASGFQQLLSPDQTRPSTSERVKRDLQKPPPVSKSAPAQSTSRPNVKVHPPTRSELIDRSVQTSPVLLEQWWRDRKAQDGQKDRNCKPSDLRQRTASLPKPTPASKPALPPKPGRKPTIDLLSRSPEPMKSPPLGSSLTMHDRPSVATAHSASQSSQEARQQVLDALPTLRANIHRGDTVYSTYDGDDDDLAIHVASELESARKLPSMVEDSDDEDELEVPEDLDAPRQSASFRRPDPSRLSGNHLGPPLDRSSSQASTVSSSDLSAQAPAMSRITTFSSEGSGNFDMGPALASLKRFAPAPADEAPSPSARRPQFPPLQQPVAQSPKPKAQISSLVSRYETISNAGATQAVDAAVKPRKRPESLYSPSQLPSRSVSISRTSADSSPETPYARPSAFKPVRPVAPTETPRQTVQEVGEEDEGFKGVADMKARWQKSIAEQNGVRRTASLSARR